MAATCNNCSHWEQEHDASNQNPDKFGVCNELTDGHSNDPEYVMPVLNHGRTVQSSESHFEMITGAEFGCNHFDNRTNRF